MSYLKKSNPISRIESSVSGESIINITTGMPIGLLLSLTYSESFTSIIKKFGSPIGRISEQLPVSRIIKTTY